MNIININSFQSFQTCNDVLKAFVFLKLQNSIKLQLSFGNLTTIVMKILESFYVIDDLMQYYCRKELK